MRKYRLYHFSYVIIPRTDIPILNNKIILLKAREPAVIIHIRQSPGKEDSILSFANFLGLLLKLCFFKTLQIYYIRKAKSSLSAVFSNCFQTLHTHLLLFSFFIRIFATDNYKNHPFMCCASA